MSHEQQNRLLPDWVDARKMADKHVMLKGLVPLSKLDRLDVVTQGDSSSMDVTAQFLVDEAHHRWLKMSVKHEMLIECQRCLEGYHYPIELDFEVMLVRDDDIAKIVPRHVEPVVLDNDQVNVWDVLVDEILLELPKVSQHNPSECRGSKSYEISPGGHEISEQEADVENPFSVLAALKKD